MNFPRAWHSVQNGYMDFFCLKAMVQKKEEIAVFPQMEKISARVAVEDLTRKMRAAVKSYFR